jgi:hypothetical protein
MAPAPAPQPSPAAQSPAARSLVKRLAEIEDRGLLAVLLYLFHRVEQRLEQGRPSAAVGPGDATPAGGARERDDELFLDQGAAGSAAATASRLSRPTAQRAAPTFADLARRYLEQYAGPKKKRSSVEGDERLLRLHILCKPESAQL